MSDTNSLKIPSFLTNSNKNSYANSEKINNMIPETRALVRIKKIFADKGLKNIDISELLGWRTPKTSKVLNANQPIRIEELQDMTYALCSAPEPFLQDRFNQSEYDKKREFQSLGNLVNAICSLKPYIDLETLLRKDFPYVMCKTAALDPLFFVKRGRAEEELDLYGEGANKKIYNKPEVYFYYRKANLGDNLVPILGYWLDSELQTLILAICVCEKGGIRLLPDISTSTRSKYKGLIDVPDEETRVFSRFMRGRKDYSSKLINCEIKSIIYDLSKNKPSNEQLENDFKHMISDYARLIYEATGSEPNFGPSISGYNSETLDIDKFIEALKKMKGSEFLEEARKEAKYKCFFADSGGSHETFTDEAGNPYVDTEYVIPMEAITDSPGDLFIKENVVCLCPLCAAKLRNAKKDVKEDMIWAIYKGKKEELKKHGIEVSLSRITELWNI